MIIHILGRYHCHEKDEETVIYASISLIGDISISTKAII